LTNGIGYTFTVHAVNLNGAGSESAASNSVTPSVPTPTTSITLTLNNASNLTGLRWASFDQVLPNLFAAPTDTGTGATTNSAGQITLTLSNSAKTSGQCVFLILSNTDGTVNGTDRKFAGPVTVT